MIIMNTYTYEREDITTELETYEWDNIWFEQTADNQTPRILYIGDSISGGTKNAVAKLSGGKYLFDSYATSKGLDNPYFKDMIHCVARQEKKRDLVIFNNGLHGFHLEDTTDYWKYYEQVVKFLLEEFPKTPIAIILTTCIEGERNERVIVRNNCAREVAEKYGLPIIDFYRVSEENVELRSSDGVHFYDEGYNKLAEELLRVVETLLQEQA